MKTIENVTPGEWETAIAVIPTFGEKPQVCVGIVGADGFKAVAACGEAGAPDEDESIANANLIAAAPKLLACCKEELIDWDMRVGRRATPEETKRRDALAQAIKDAEVINLLP